MALSAATKSFMVLGECVPCLKHNASKFKIKRLELDTNLLMVIKCISIKIGTYKIVFHTVFQKR